MSDEPVAWAVMDGTRTLVGYHSCSRDKAEAWAKEYGFPEIVPLYRSPTLTDYERKAIKAVVGGLGMWVAENGLADDESLRLAVLTLRGLLERTA